ncbi:hypothetical protein HYX10_00885 [Candidatus Woesearchaeota archaeon]|nr:hypothetical protein [Candidatus Woesearchaeota archaeon]
MEEYKPRYNPGKAARFLSDVLAFNLTGYRTNPTGDTDSSGLFEVIRKLRPESLDDAIDEAIATAGIGEGAKELVLRQAGLKTGKEQSYKELEAYFFPDDLKGANRRAKSILEAMHKKLAGFGVRRQIQEELHLKIGWG